LVGRAINYAIEQQEYLMRVFLDGRLELSNNRALLSAFSYSEHQASSQLEELLAA
jgi:hypothetical protein